MLGWHLHHRHLWLVVLSRWLRGLLLWTHDDHPNCEKVPLSKVFQNIFSNRLQWHMEEWSIFHLKWWWDCDNWPVHSSWDSAGSLPRPESRKGPQRAGGHRPRPRSQWEDSRARSSGDLSPRESEGSRGWRGLRCHPGRRAEPQAEDGAAGGPLKKKKVQCMECNNQGGSEFLS